MGVNHNLIIDVGMHKAEDTSFFLKKGFNVVAIDADPVLVDNAKNLFNEHIRSGQLIVLNYAIAQIDDAFISFNVSNNSMWNSLKSSIASRKDAVKEVIQVETKKLSTVFKLYGVPYYCKIDVEGYDIICLQTLSCSEELPLFISVESECIGANETISEEQALETLVALKHLGYQKFKLVDQESLCVLKPGQRFYFNMHSRLSFTERVKRKVNRYMPIFQAYSINYRAKLNKAYKHDFLPGASGLFGNDLPEQWLNFEQAKETLLYHRSCFFEDKSLKSYAFWCDWHATR